MSPATDLAPVRQTVLRELLAARNARGHWEGRLSSSALSTATAVTALAIVGRHGGELASAQQALIEGGLRWLAKHRNADGGWGDTVDSLSNISTTALGWAAFGAVAGADTRFVAPVREAAAWLRAKAGGLEPASLAAALVRRYGQDRTFSVPILTHCALAGRLGAGDEAWRHVPQLPFELAALPQSLFAALRLPVVSYALPALIAIGQVRHHQRPSRSPLRWLRQVTRRRTLEVLAHVQPPNGGFLEATPLTSFVTMSLAACGQVGHAVTRRGVAFLQASVRPDGSWPIDTNLATWVTTLSINALGPDGLRRLSTGELETLRGWLLGQQYREVHAYTGAAPGGWAWTDLPGGVPDADDTAGALLALRALDDGRPAIVEAAERGLEWLLNLQNRDGGIPTFCRGWTDLPFDRSGADLTAHALRAWAAWLRQVPADFGRRLESARKRAVAFLRHTQRPDGTWLPLWFGNQHLSDETNPTYGTAKVLLALADPWVAAEPEIAALREPALRWLLGAMNADGSWGGGAGSHPSVEETALAVEALAAYSRGPEDSPRRSAILERGSAWLRAAVMEGRWQETSPIGFYFARLWYSEHLYPTIAVTAAINRTLSGNHGKSDR